MGARPGGCQGDKHGIGEGDVEVEALCGTRLGMIFVDTVGRDVAAGSRMSTHVRVRMMIYWDVWYLVRLRFGLFGLGDPAKESGVN